MDFRVFVETQRGCRYEQVLELARTAETLGLNGVFTADHYLPTTDDDGRPGPLDAWTTLAGLARDTSRITVGSLMSPVTFRSPGQLAVIAAQVDSMSGGRVMLGLGAGWHEPEHRAFGLPMPPLGERLDRLAEQLEIITGMWRATAPFTYVGRHYRVEDNPGLPKPVLGRGVPIIVGGTGPVRTPLLACRFADEYNVPQPTLAQAAGLMRSLDTACRATGRKRESIRTSLMLRFCVGRTSAEVQRRAERIGVSLEEVRATGIAGTVDAAIESLALWRKQIQPDVIYLHVVDIADLEHLALFAAEVVPRPVMPQQRTVPANSREAQPS